MTYNDNLNNLPVSENKIIDFNYLNLTKKKLKFTFKILNNI